MATARRSPSCSSPSSSRARPCNCGCAGSSSGSGRWRRHRWGDGGRRRRAHEASGRGRPAARGARRGRRPGPRPAPVDGLGVADARRRGHGRSAAAPAEPRQARALSRARHAPRPDARLSQQGRARRRGHPDRAGRELDSGLRLRQAPLRRARAPLSPAARRARDPGPGGHAAALPHAPGAPPGEHVRGRDGPRPGERVRHLPGPPVRPLHPGERARRRPHRRRRRAPHLPLAGAVPLRAHPGDARRLHVHGDVERLHVAARRARRRAPLHPAGRAREPRRRARAGRGAHDGRGRADRAARRAALRLPAALLHRRHHGRRREGVARRVTTARRATWAAALLLALHLGGAPARAEGVVLDDFETLAGWTTVASEGARVWTLQEPGHSGMGMRVGFDLGAGGGYVIVHKQLSLPLPENYAFTFSLRGEGRRNNFEFKLLDPTGKSVWWRNQRDFSFPTDWQPVTIRKSRLSLAWGPSKTREPKQVGAIEFAISSGEGGSGSFWIDDLGFEEREPAVQDGVPPDVQASTSLAGHEPPLMLDQDPATGWKSDPVPSTQWVVLDFRKNREYGGLVIDWDADDYATAFAVQASNDGTQWTTSFATTTGHGGRDYIYLPEAESRFVRLDLQHSSRAQGYGIATLMVKPFSFSASPNDFFAAIARDAPAG